MDFSKVLHGFVKFDTWISLSFYMDLWKLKDGFSKLLQGFVKIETGKSLNCNMDLSKLLRGFVKVVTWICQSCSIYFLPFANQNPAVVWPRF